MHRTSFDEGWYVRKEGAPDRPVVGPVTLPYDAMLSEPRDPESLNAGHTGYHPGGTYRYSRTFVAPEQWRESAVVLEFEGVYRRSQVFVNGRLAGGRPSGYAVFHVSLDDFLAYGTENTIEVVADNSDSPNARWYTGSGIYRPVHVLVGGRTHIAPLGLRATTSSIAGSTATVAVRTDLVIDSAARSGPLQLLVELVGPDGRALPPVRVIVPSTADPRVSVVEEVAVSDALLWSPQNPQMYSVRVSIISGEEVLDSAHETFGIRTVTADAQNGLRINGEALKLRGSCIHHDNGVIGAHTLDAAEDRRIRLLKESGYNAVRSAHNPASRALLRACDRHGMLVMDELTDAWLRPKVAFDYSLDFADWWERDLDALVGNDVNHPSVIMYSIGNEIAETATPHGIELNRRMANRTRELDPTRLVTNGINGFLNLISPMDEEKLAKKAAAARESGENPNKNLIGILNRLLGFLNAMLDRIVRLPAVDKRTRDAFADLDVAGYNYLIGRYGIDHTLHPDRVIVGSETRAAHGIRNWKEAEKFPHVIGDFTWTGWDYIGEAGLATKQYGKTNTEIYHPYPALLAGEPVIDITGFRQTQSYLNEIGWGLTRGPHIAVEPVNHSGEKVVKTGWRATNSIDSWSWEGCEGRPATVEVYADATTVELLLNGRVVGTGAAGRDDDYLTKFTIPYATGELTAVAYDSNGRESGRRTLTSAGPSLRLDVQPETTTMIADGHDLAYIPIVLTDDDGIVRPLADRTIHVTVEGEATLLGLGSGEAITEEGFATTSHRSFNGRALAVVRAGHRPGVATVTISAQGVATVRTQLHLVAAPADTGIKPVADLDPTTSAVQSGATV